MNTDPKVLIVTSAFGDGHMKVAEAIEHSFRRRGLVGLQLWIYSLQSTLP